MRFKLTTDQGEFETISSELIEKINEIMFLNSVLIGVLEQCNIEEPTILSIIERIKELNAEAVNASTDDVNITVTNTFSVESEIVNEVDTTNVVKFEPKNKKSVEEDLIA